MVTAGRVLIETFAFLWEILSDCMRLYDIVVCFVIQEGTHTNNNIKE